MRRILMMPVLLLAVALAGCGPGTKVGNFIAAATAPFNNPVTPTNLYQGKVVFAGTQELVLKYQDDCFGSQSPPYPVTVKKINSDPVLAVQCKHRVSRYNAMKVAEANANAAILLADDFIMRNPTGNAASYIAAALKAVTAYKATVRG